MFGIMTKRKIIKAFAKDIAYKQKRADWQYYIGNDKEMSSYMLEGVSHMQRLMRDLGITAEVYKEAYKIYDFRNSGKKDFVPNLEELKKDPW